MSSSTSTRGLWYDPELQLLICKVHGFGIHPTPQAITRHLRGDGHYCRGKTLKLAVDTLINLPLRSIDELVKQVPPVEEQPIPVPIQYLRVLPGWTCLACNGCYLTTSFELVQRHSSTEHQRRRGDPPLWADCYLQTFFQETKDRRYFRVRDSRSRSTQDEDSNAISEMRKKSTAKRPDVARRRKTDRSSASSRCFATPAAALSFVHPFAQLAKAHVSLLSIGHLDGLFKSESFAAASEPLFDPSHVDSTTNMQKVFPDCNNEPLFYHALVYSMIRSSSREEASPGSIALEKEIVDLINHQQVSPIGVSQATVGAIMLLKTTAYKLEDRLAHAIHSEGLQAALHSCGRHKLTSHARRALFWQDVYAAVFLGCDLATEHDEMFENVRWARETSSDNAEPYLPTSFSRHASLLPPGLLDIVIDLLEMKTYVPILAQLPWYMRYQHLDSMQASIESRLVRQSTACRAMSSIAEVVRLAVFLCCYCAWMEIWNDRFVPCKLAEKLLDMLEPTISTGEHFESDWSGRLDLLLWSAFVCCNVIELDDGRIPQLRSRRKQLLCTIANTICARETPNVVLALSSAVNDFMYCDWWSTSKTQISEWKEIERAILDNVNV